MAFAPGAVNLLGVLCYLLGNINHVLIGGLTNHDHGKPSFFFGLSGGHYCNVSPFPCVGAFRCCSIILAVGK